MAGCFSNCNSLKSANIRIPDKVTSIEMLFLRDNNLREANLVLPNGLEDMNMAFHYCTSLEKGSDIIPESVKNMNQTFESDAKLTGEMTINASPTKYGNVFRTAATDTNAKLVIKTFDDNIEFIQNMIETDGRYSGENIYGEWEL